MPGIKKHITNKECINKHKVGREKKAERKTCKGRAASRYAANNANSADKHLEVGV
jgi:hypothetical protein